MQDEYDAQTDGHYNSETSNSVGQDGEETQSENSGGWEEQAKYFQSEKDKLYGENQKLKKLAKIGEFIQERPDVAKKLAGYIRGDEPTESSEPAIERTEYDSWEAYNDPSSKSYQARQEHSVKEIDQIVQARVDSALSNAKTENNVKAIAGKLAEKGYNKEEIKSFFQFATEGPTKHGLDGAIKAWEAVENPEKENVNPLDAVRNTQNNPQTGGIIQGHMPAKKDATDELWKIVLGASGPMGVNGKLP